MVGTATWLIGLLITTLFGVLEAIAAPRTTPATGPAFPRLSLNLTELGACGACTAGLLGSVLAAILGGKAGHRYDHKVDQAPGINR